MNKFMDYQTFMNQYTKVGERFMPLLQDLMIKDNIHPFSIYMACVMLSKAYKQYSKAVSTDDKQLEIIMNKLEQEMANDAENALFPKIKKVIDEGRNKDGSGWNQYDNKTKSKSNTG